MLRFFSSVAYLMGPNMRLNKPFGGNFSPVRWYYGCLTVCGGPSSWDVLAAESGPKVRHGADERGDQRGVLRAGSPGHGVVQRQHAHE